ncbi:uncharacterized protein BYT42DRAFT_362621 [Radiomyces spectabilis]|uniref:uncharacterized protein n=1 Tax=Radiomyces spectabilis TaxID=64574 RepID=UPI0022202A2F|nr:uncharacterized protein BYT42DRAFT_362621 [Radiomyces spectabilis]KAI8377944.1 hypothetical protein BYT42DRAFT_362621 [Radiomyces spectabilis]
MESQRILSSLDRPPASESAIEPTELFAIRDEVRAANETRLAALPGRIHVFKAIDQGERDKIAPCLAPEILQLKKHAQVMLLRNMDRQLVNGSLGIVVGFTGEDEYADPSVLGQILGQWGMAATNRPGFPIVQFSNGRKQAIYPEKWSLEMGNSITDAIAINVGMGMVDSQKSRPDIGSGAGGSGKSFRKWASVRCTFSCHLTPRTSNSQFRSQKGHGQPESGQVLSAILNLTNDNMKKKIDAYPIPCSFPFFSRPHDSTNL